MFTGDREFLKERAVPFMKEVALFYEDFVLEDAGGTYVFSPSMSPENRPGNSRSLATMNATMDIAVAKEVLANLVAACETLNIYTKSHRHRLDDGRVVPWIDENLDPYTGQWLARLRKLPSSGKNERPRGKDYNHSSYCDLVISGLMGLRPRANDIVEVNPLVPEDTWKWFCLDNVLYHGRIITILWDKNGTKYGKGTGLRVFADGEEIAHSHRLMRVTGKLP